MSASEDSWPIKKRFLLINQSETELKASIWKPTWSFKPQINDHLNPNSYSKFGLRLHVRDTVSAEFLFKSQSVDLKLLTLQ